MSETESEVVKDLDGLLTEKEAEISEKEFEALNDLRYSGYMQMLMFVGEEVKGSSLVHDLRSDKYEKNQRIDVSK